MTKTKKRAWINTDQQMKKQKTTTQESISAGNPEEIPPFRFRFPTDIAVERYDRISHRSLLYESYFTRSECDEPIVSRLIKSHKWEIFCQRPSPASVPLVKEFYANYDPKRAHVVRVRGKLVDASPSAINSVYSLADHKKTFFEATSKVRNFNDDIVEELTGKRETRANLLYCITVGKPINVGKVIAKQIRICARKLKRPGAVKLWFPSLITRLCERHNILPNSCILEGLVEKTVNESEPDQQTSHSDYAPSNNGWEDVITEENIRGAAANVEQPVAEPQGLHAPFMHPNEVVDDVLDAPERVDEQVDEAQDDIADVDDPVNLVYSPVAEQQEDLIDFAIEDQEMGFDAGNVSYDAATSSQHVSPVAPSAPPAEPSCPSQTDLDEQPLGQALPIKVSSPQCGTICVQGYNVKQSVAPILEAIFKKHGDIAAECLFKTAPVRSYFLEVVCEAVTRIEMDDVTEKMEEINCRVSDAEAANINVSWLRAHLEAVKRKKAIKKWDLLMETKVNTGLVKRAAQMDLRERCEELVAAQERFEKAERCARVLHLVEKNLKSAILESKDVNSLLSKDRII